jgi:hypothetical protein
MEDKTMKGTRPWLMIALAMVLASCADTVTEPTPPPDPTLNAPVTANVTNSFSYSVKAAGFYDSSGNTLTFTSDSLVVSLTSTGYVSGLAVVSVRDSLNSTIFSDTVRSNKTIAVTDLTATMPKYCTVIVDGLTGTLVFAIVGQ